MIVTYHPYRDLFKVEWRKPIFPNQKEPRSPSLFSVEGESTAAFLYFLPLPQEQSLFLPAFSGIGLPMPPALKQIATL
jgi:hypothetical protein